jgi:hypothetical protein
MQKMDETAYRNDTTDRHRDSDHRDRSRYCFVTPIHRPAELAEPGPKRLSFIVLAASDEVLYLRPDNADIPQYRVIKLR